jgi:hypothetical protein
MNFNLANRLDGAMTQEQFTQIMDAILDRKYSWACVLILRFAGYNPLHYIPYRTYNRLMKDNSPTSHSRTIKNGRDSKKNHPTSRPVQNRLGGLEDLGYPEALNDTQEQIHGGDGNLCLEYWLK